MRLFGNTQPAFSEMHWTCRPCDNDQHDKCWEEVNGVYCGCPCDEEPVAPTEENENA
jgi:hypothetical protein